MKIHRIKKDDQEERWSDISNQTAMTPHSKLNMMTTHGSQGS
jgi:hypothetical protein